MTNKIETVELVWTLGAMLAKSAELAGAGAAGEAGVSSWTWSKLIGLLFALAACWYFCCMKPAPPPRLYNKAASTVPQAHPL